MSIVAAIVAGVIGAIIMVGVTNLLPRVGMPKIDFIAMLGTLFTEHGDDPMRAGGVAHMVMGALFASVYAWVWANYYGAPTWEWGGAFGAVHGSVATLVMPIAQLMHPRPPEMEIRGTLAIEIVIVHLVFGAVVGLVYGGMV